MKGVVTFIRGQREQVSGFIQRGRYKYSFRAKDVVSGLPRLGVGQEVEFESVRTQNPHVTAKAVSVMALPLEAEADAQASGLSVLAQEVN